MSKSRSFRSDPPPPGYSVDHSAGPLYRFQASLPRLPVPTLSSTASKYLESIRPHISPSAFSDAESATSAFLRSPLAAELQKRLEARAADPNMLNWLAAWWNDVAYMGYRDPVVVFVSYFYVHLDDTIKRDQADRAARLLKSILSFRELTESCV
jgi:carnitine O-acetyltransferase